MMIIKQFQIFFLTIVYYITNCISFLFILSIDNIYNPEAKLYEISQKNFLYSNRNSIVIKYQYFSKMFAYMIAYSRLHNNVYLLL